MAISIIQQPSGSSNATFTQLPYVVSGSTNTLQPQFEYVMDIYPSGSTTLITRVSQPVNPAGVAVFNPGKIFQGDAKYSQEWKQVLNSGSLVSDKQYDIKFGEKYGTSISSSVTVYPNQVTTSIALAPASVDPNDGSYDLYGVYPYLRMTGLPISTIFDDTQLSDNPYLFYVNDDRNPYYSPNNPYDGQNISVLPVSSTDYATVTYLIKEVKPVYINVSAYDINMNRSFYGWTYINPALVNPALYYFLSGSVYYTGSIDSDVNIFSIGVGAANLRDIPMGNTFTGSLGNKTFGEVIDSGSWAWHRVYSQVQTYDSIVSEDIDVMYAFNDQYDAKQMVDLITGVLGDTVNETIPYYINCNQKVRFAFINKYGAWDYWSNFNPVRRNTNIQRETVILPKVDYSSATSPYSYTSRGNKQYFQDFTDTYTVDTDYLDQPFANWLEQLLESPSVFIQQGDEFIPIVITNSSYTANTSTARQKLFKYTITFQPAKGRQLFF